MYVTYSFVSQPLAWENSPSASSVSPSNLPRSVMTRPWSSSHLCNNKSTLHCSYNNGNSWAESFGQVLLWRSLSRNLQDVVRRNDSLKRVPSWIDGRSIKRKNPSPLEWWTTMLSTTIGGGGIQAWGRNDGDCFRAKEACRVDLKSVFYVDVAVVYKFTYHLMLHRITRLLCYHSIPIWSWDEHCA